jgi:hypothetical protein
LYLRLGWGLRQGRRDQGVLYSCTVYLRLDGDAGTAGRRCWRSELELQWGTLGHTSVLTGTGREDGADQQSAGAPVRERYSGLGSWRSGGGIREEGNSLGMRDRVAETRELQPVEPGARRGSRRRRCSWGGGGRLRGGEWNGPRVQGLQVSFFI